MGADLQIAKKLLKGSVARLRGLLLHPVAHPGNKRCPAEVRAACARIGVEIQAWNEVTHGIPLTADKAAGLRQKGPVLRRKLLRIQALGTIAIQRPPKAPSAKGAGVDGKILIAHPPGEGFRARQGL